MWGLHRLMCISELSSQEFLLSKFSIVSHGEQDFIAAKFSTAEKYDTVAVVMKGSVPGYHLA